MNDLKISCRSLLKSPGFTAVVVLTLALGIGANTAIFSVINAVLLRPPPFDEPGRLVFISDKRDGASGSIAYPNFLDWQAQQQGFSSLAAFRETGWNLTGSGEPEKVTGLQVSASFFPTLRVSPLLGRVFTEAEDRVGGERVALLSEGLWRRRFGGSPTILNQSITLDGQPYLVLGIMPAAFQFPRRVELWTPLGHQAPWTANRGWHPDIYALGRLKPGVDVNQARKGLEVVAARLAKEYPNTNTNLGVDVMPLQERVAAANVRLALNLLFGAVAFVLLIACTNITNLLLARATQRRREMALRIAMGAGRRHLLRHLLAESLLLAGIGGLAGLVLAHWSLDVLRQLLPADLEDMVTLKIDRTVLLFSLAVATVCGLLFGLAPAWQLGHRDFTATLRKGGGRESVGWGWSRRGLIIGEIALASVLLVGAGLLLQSFSRLQSVPLGLDSRNVLTLEIGLPGYKYPDTQKQAAFFRQACEAVRALPGVVSAGFIAPLPVGIGGWSADAYFEGEPPAQGGPPTCDFAFVTPDYFKAIGVTLLKGRYFTDADDGQQRVCIVDETLEKKYFHGVALGRRMAIAGTNWMTVVGVVRHVKNYGADKDSRMETYFPVAQDGVGWMTMVVKTSVRPLSLAKAVRGAIQSVDPEQPVTKIRTMEQILSHNVADHRLSVLLLGLFAGLAVVLAGVGLYGVMAFSVASRTREIGIRMALGAQVNDVLGLVLHQGACLVGIGAVLGLCGAFGLTRLMTSLLFQTRAVDPVSFVATPLVLIAVGLVACWLPARRAARVDPIQALRAE